MSDTVAVTQDDVLAARDEAATFILSQMAEILEVKDWTIHDGSETWKGDVSATLYHILVDAKVIDDEDGSIARHAALQTQAQPEAPVTDGLTAELEALLAETSEGPWAYRPDEFDDWGVIRGPAKTVDWADHPVRPHVAQARHSELQDSAHLAKCREEKRDPWAGDAKLIVWLRNHAETILTTLRQHDQGERDKVLEEAREAYPLGTLVTKTKGSKWTGKVVGYYATDLTPAGVAIESETETGSVQIYPIKAIRALKGATQ